MIKNNYTDLKYVLYLSILLLKPTQKHKTYIYNIKKLSVINVTRTENNYISNYQIRDDSYLKKNYYILLLNSP